MRTIGKVLIFASIFNTAGSAFAQAPDTLWTRTYGGIYDNLPEKGCATVEGNYVLAGSTNSYAPFDHNIGALCFTSTGDTGWTAYYGAPSRTDYGRVVAATIDSGLVFAGNANIGDFQTLLVKTDLKGKVKWQKTYPKPLDAWPAGAVALADTGFIVGGYAKNLSNPSNVDFYALRTKPNGDTLWTRSYGTALEEYAYGTCATTDTGMIVVGYSVAAGTGDRDVYAVRIRSNGDTAWTRTYGGPTWDEAWSIIPLSDGSYLIGGYTIASPGGENVLLIKISGDGSVQWTSAIGGAENERAYDVRETSDHGIVIGGRTVIAGKSHQMLLMRANASGAFLWSTHCGGAGFEYASFVHQNLDGTFILGGRTNSGTGGYYKYYLAKYAATATGVDANASQLPEHLFLHQNYPNPFNPTTVVEFDLPTTSPVSVTVYSLLGQEVAVLVSSTLSAGHHRVEWNAAGFPSGVYICRLDAASQSATRKFVLLR